MTFDLRPSAFDLSTYASKFINLFGLTAYIKLKNQFL
jgi:hypothetical protein